METIIIILLVPLLAYCFCKIGFNLYCIGSFILAKKRVVLELMALGCPRTVANKIADKIPGSVLAELPPDYIAHRIAEDMQEKMKR